MVLVVVVVSLVCGGAWWVFRDRSPVGHWRSPEGEQLYHQAYAEAMRSMPQPSRTVDIRTDWGTVRGYLWENATTRSRTPIVLFPGWTSGVPMWSENLPGLIEERPVYAFDALGDAGLSVQTRTLASNADQAEWIDQVLAGSGLERVHVAGHSFGGWLSVNYAVRKPERVASVSVLDPPLVFASLPLSVILTSIPASIPWLPSSWRDAALENIGGGPVDLGDPVARMIAMAVEHYAPKKPAPEQITTDQLRGMTMPVLVALAGRSFLEDAPGSAAVARASIPRVTVRIWPQATHSLPMEYPDEVGEALLDFMADAERAPAR